MNPQTYQQFTNDLIRTLERDPDVMGLVGLGSMADATRRDEWSDHDFFVVVKTGKQGHFRDNLQWLPDSGRIALAYLETQHGLKVIYDDGHLLEFAIFDEEELFLAKVNDYDVLFDRGEIADSLAKIATSSKAIKPRDDHFYWGQFLAHLIVGAGRYMRGEKISGHVFIKQYALDDILPLFIKHCESSDKVYLDNLDSRRRFEQVFPEIGAAINEIMLKDVLVAAQALLDLAQTHLSGVISYPAQAIQVTRTYIASQRA